MRAFTLLVAAGSLLGFSTVLVKIAAQAGVPAYAFLTFSSAGAACLLLLRARPAPTRAVALYLVGAASVTIAAPNLLFYSAVPHVGVGLVALALAFPPVLTYAGAWALGMEPFHPWRAAGVLSALAGAVTLAVLRLDAADAPAWWVAAPFLGAAFLAAGNIYRSRFWPEGAKPEALASGMVATAAIMLASASAAPGFSLALPAGGAEVWAPIALQAATLAGMYLLFFPLQRIGGPVYLSLLGSVATLFGVPAAILALGEAPPPGLAPAAALIALGIYLVVRHRH